MFQHLVESLSRRVEAVIAANVICHIDECVTDAHILERCLRKLYVEALKSHRSFKPHNSVVGGVCAHVCLSVQVSACLSMGLHVCVCVHAHMVVYLCVCASLQYSLS